MKQPFFRVGEEVYVFPLGGGKYEATVVSQYYQKTPIDEVGHLHPPMWTYYLDISQDNNNDPWAECILRKKYKPGDSFDKIIRDIKTPTPETMKA